MSPLLATGAGGAGAEAAPAGAGLTAAGEGVAATAADVATAAGAAAGGASGVVAAEAAGAAAVSGGAVGVWANAVVPDASKPNPKTKEAKKFFISVFLFRKKRLNSCAARALQRFFAGFAGANAHNLLQVIYKHLAVTNLAGAGRALDGFNHAVNQFVRHGCFNFDFG